MNDTLLKVLSWVDTPTVCNAIEVAQAKRGYCKFTRSTVSCSTTGGLPLVGYARTARIIGTQPLDDEKEIAQSGLKLYFEYITKVTPPCMMVVQDMDYPNCVGAFWGEISSHIHKKLGYSGVLTNGVMRDINALPDHFPIIAGSIGPSQGHARVVDTGKPVEIFGLTVTEGDFIHADQHGAVIIPPDILPVIDKVITELIGIEGKILGPISKDNLTFEEIEAAWNEFEALRLNPTSGPTRS